MKSTCRILGSIAMAAAIGIMFLTEQGPDIRHIHAGTPWMTIAALLGIISLLLFMLGHRPSRGGLHIGIIVLMLSPVLAKGESFVQAYSFGNVLRVNTETIGAFVEVEVPIGLDARQTGAVKRDVARIAADCFGSRYHVGTPKLDRPNPGIWISLCHHVMQAWPEGRFDIFQDVRHSTEYLTYWVPLEKK